MKTASCLVRLALPVLGLALAGCVKAVTAASPAATL